MRTTTTYYSNQGPVTGSGADPLGLEHERRVQQGGGQHVNGRFLGELVELLRQLNLTDKIMHLSDARLGCQVDEQGRVSRLFCLAGHDAVAIAGVTRPQLVAAGLRGRPQLEFHHAGLVVEDFDLSRSDTYSLVTLLRQGEAGGMIACQPNSPDHFGVFPAYGYLRCRHTQYYTGQELVFNDGTNYDGGWVTLSARYNLARPQAQLMGKFYSFRTRSVHAMGYAYDNHRGARLGPAPLYLGSPSTADGALISLCLLRDVDDEFVLTELREFLQADYVS